MHLIVEGLSYRAAPLAVRERVFLNGEGLRRWLGRISARESLSGGAILSTCNRTEVYVTAPDPAAARVELDAIGGSLDPQGDWPRHAYRLEGTRALEHLFKVPAGMDSAIVGEAQILGQFKASHEIAREAGAIDARLDFLMRRAITAAKRVRTETAIGRNAVGFGHAAVEQARLVFGSLEGRSVLLVGAGKMAGSTARLLAGEGAARVYFSTRTPTRAVELAAEMPAGVVALAVPYSHMDELAAEVDLVVCSTSSPDHVFGREAVERIMRRRRHRPLFLLDLAVPRDIDPAVAEIDDAYLYNIDDLGAIVDRGLGARREELPAAEAIIREELARVASELDAHRAAPAIAALVRRAEAVRLAQLEATTDAAERERVDRVSRRLVARLLHAPITYLRAHPDDEEALRLVGEMFDVDPGAER